MPPNLLFFQNGFNEKKKRSEENKKESIQGQDSFPKNKEQKGQKISKTKEGDFSLINFNFFSQNFQIFLLVRTKCQQQNQLHCHSRLYLREDVNKNSI